MNETKTRILIFGAGVIGSLYAVRFSETGFDVTLFARGARLTTLREKGLLYNHKNTTKKADVNIIEKLEDDDIYDFIFVAVRYDQVESALIALKQNKSKNIVTLANTVRYDSWLEIIGDKLIPGFPGAGGDIKDGVLYGKFAPKNTQGTMFGEIDGKTTDRIISLSKMFETAALPFEVAENILAFHITHATVVAANKYFYTDNGMINVQKTKMKSILHNFASEIKANLSIVEKAGIQITPSKIGIIKKIPNWVIAALVSLLLNIKFTRDVLLGNHALSARAEVFLLDKDFHSLLAGDRATNSAPCHP
jgi:2-dehydropantoate 2-reductase